MITAKISSIKSGDFLPLKNMLHMREDSMMRDFSDRISVTIFGDLLDFGHVFKAFGSN